MEKELLKALYGTASAAEILRRKSECKQIRAMAGGADGLRTLTEDECRKMCAKVNGKGIEYLSGYEARVVSYTITDETVDRYGDIVRAKGVRLANYVNNSVIQFAHDYEQPPVGVSLKTWYDKQANAVKSLGLFYDDRVDSTGRSDLIFRFVASGGMPGTSIGFMPMKTTRPTDDERTELHMGEYGVIFDECDLMEFSVVPVPANPNALKDDIAGAWRERMTKAVSGGMFRQADLKRIEAMPQIDKAVVELFAKEFRRAVPVTNSNEKTCDKCKAFSDRVKQLWIFYDSEIIERDAVLRPYPNEHAARLADPDSMDEFRRKADGEVRGKKVPDTADVIWGHLKDGDENAWAPQAIRFPTKDWTVEQAKKWLEDNDIKPILFEPAKEEGAESPAAESPAAKTVDPVIVNLSVNVPLDTFVKQVNELTESVKSVLAEIQTAKDAALAEINAARTAAQPAKTEPKMGSGIYRQILGLK
jgi:hypothetical protein